MPRIDIISGGQFGSEAKGHVAQRVQEIHGHKWSVRVGGPNAGHSATDKHGKVWALRTIPVGAVVNDTCKLVVAQGSEIDPNVLDHEVNMLEAAGIPVRDRLFIDETATIITQDHIDEEAAGAMTDRLGSTAKGIGAARAARLMRRAHLAANVGSVSGKYNVTNTARMLTESSRTDSIIIEGTQGYGLGLHAGYYPFSTSGDCRAIDFLAQSGIGTCDAFHAWVVFRVYPIRVAGNSGPLAGELSWEELGESSGGYIQPEKTTVTKKTRRVGEFDFQLAEAALLANGHPNPRVNVVVSFADYLDPKIAGTTSRAELCSSDAVMSWLDNFQSTLRVKVAMVTTGPNSAVLVK